MPTTEFTLVWEHSVEKTRWEERYRSDSGKLVLIEARIQGFGAGMEPPPDATLRDGWWTWRPQRFLTEVALADSAFGGEYRICYAARCTTLNALLQPGTTGPVTLRSCAATPSD